jgi:hypothetical protein
MHTDGAPYFMHAYRMSHLFYACVLMERFVLCMLTDGATCFMHAYLMSHLFYACILMELFVPCMSAEGATLIGPANSSEQLLASLCHILQSNTFGRSSVTLKIGRIYQRDSYRTGNSYDAFSLFRNSLGFPPTKATNINSQVAKRFRKFTFCRCSDTC